MRIKVLRNLGRGLPPYKESQVVEASDAEGKRLVDLKLAEPTDEEVTPEELHAVPSAATIGKAKSEPGTVERATEDLKEFKDRTSRRSASATPATPETIGRNPHDPGK